MELSLTKRATKHTKEETSNFEISDYKVLVGTGSSLLLVQEGKMEIDDATVKINDDFLEIFKVQFIASCKTELEGKLIVAFYIGEYSSLYGYVLEGLPDNYYQEGDSFRLVDYNSYTEICEMTGETKLSFKDYIKEIRLSRIGVNTLLLHNDKFLNYDNQQTLYKEIDSKNINPN